MSNNYYKDFNVVAHGSGVVQILPLMSDIFLKNRLHDLS